MDENNQKTPSDHCNHFVMRKKRYCRMTVKPGEKYCGEHQPPTKGIQDATEDKKIRVVCPLDRKHTCYAHNLKKHLKICNARPGIALPYIEKGINSGEVENNSGNSHRLLSEFSTEEITAVVTKINKIFEGNSVGKVTSKLITHEVVEKEIAKPEHGDKSKKHLKQASAVLGLLTEYDLLRPNTCYVEFGAGRGQLSYWLAQTKDSSNSYFLLIERSSPKHKRDNKLDKTDDKVQRIRADIADLVLSKVDAITKTSEVVAVTKHLCGDATDLALRCLTNVADQSVVAGCVMTFCCHHRCRWASYTGKEYFSRVELSKNDFDMMCGMSSWATCGTGFSREKNIEKSGDVEIQNERDRQIGLNRFQKEQIGKRCKAILNWGRLQYLEGLGFKCNLHFYVGTDVSLENVCIVAHKRQTNKV